MFGLHRILFYWGFG